MTAQSYRIRVDYRTQTFCNSKTVEVIATSYEEAFALASDKVRRPGRRIDGGTAIGQPINIESDRT